MGSKAMARTQATMGIHKLWPKLQKVVLEERPDTYHYGRIENNRNVETDEMKKTETENDIDGNLEIVNDENNNIEKGDMKTMTVWKNWTKYIMEINNLFSNTKRRNGFESFT